MENHGKRPSELLAGHPAAQASTGGVARLVPQASVDVGSPTSVVTSLEAWELALEAWVDVRPQGYVVEESRIWEALPAIASRIPRCSSRPSSDLTARQGNSVIPGLSELFMPSPRGSPPVFLALLRAHDGKVHFLHFWRAFGEAAHSAGACLEEGLTCELEVLRDRVLRHLEEQAAAGNSENDRVLIVPNMPMLTGSRPHCMSSYGSACPSPCGAPSGVSRVLPAWALVEEVHRAASMSAYPRFWQRISEALASQLQLEELTIEEVTSVLLSWLHDAQLWEQQQKRKAHQDGQHLRSSSIALPSVGPASIVTPSGLPVRLHIYDVSQEEGIQKLNRVLAHKHSPLKFGGVFHAGVEVNGLEWSYGYSPCETHPGVSCMEPRTHPQHHFRQTVVLRHTQVPAEGIADIISELVEQYPGHDYHLLRRNCCHFADDFCRRLGVGGIPGWVHRLARLGAGLDTLLQNAPGPIKDRVYG